MHAPKHAHPTRRAIGAGHVALPFPSEEQETPLISDQTLSLLHASGLQIDATVVDQVDNSKPVDDTPWIVCGDFNKTIDASDRSNTRRSSDTAFAQLINSLGLLDMRLHGRQYTWSNE